jgi:hypothetical protein
MSLGETPAVIMALFIIAVVGVATFLALDGLKANLDAGSAGANATEKIETGVSNVFQLAPTWGTLIGVGVLLGIVAGFLVLGAIGYQAGRSRGYF